MSDQNQKREKSELEGGSRFGKSTRRIFLSRLGMAGLLVSTRPMIGEPARAESPPPSTPELEGATPVTLRVNGKKYDLRIDPRTTLLDCLREHLHLTGSKKGCDHGQCGACTVHINGRRVNSFSLSPRCTTARKSQPLRGSDSRKIYTLFKLRSSPLTLINAVTAHRDRSC